MFSRQSSDDHEQVSIRINGNDIKANSDDTVAAASLCAGLSCTRTTAITGAPRAPYCLMGVCFECLMVIDGKPNQRACMTQVKEGMCVSCQHGTGVN